MHKEHTNARILALLQPSRIKSIHKIITYVSMLEFNGSKMNVNECQCKKATNSKKWTFQQLNKDNKTSVYYGKAMASPNVDRA